MGRPMNSVQSWSDGVYRDPITDAGPYHKGLSSK